MSETGRREISKTMRRKMLSSKLCFYDPAKEKEVYCRSKIRVDMRRILTIRRGGRTTRLCQMRMDKRERGRTTERVIIQRRRKEAHWNNASLRSTDRN